MNSKIEELNELKKEICEQCGHNYNFWSNEKEKATRICKDCGYKEVLPLTEEIKSQIEKQNQAKELLNYLKNTKEETLTPENILFYLWSIKGYIDYMDTTDLKDTISKINKPHIDSLAEYGLINSLVISIDKINTKRFSSDEEQEQLELLWLELEQFIKTLTPQPKGLL